MSIRAPRIRLCSKDADSVNAKVAITWVGAADGVSAEESLEPGSYDHLFTDPQPDWGA